MAGLSDIPLQINETLKLVRKTRERLKAKMDDGVEFTKSDSDAVYKLSQTVSSLSREGRAWAGKVQKDLKSMSLKQKSEVMVSFVQSLSKADRKRLYGRLDDEECARKPGERVRYQIG